MQAVAAVLRARDHVCERGLLDGIEPRPGVADRVLEATYVRGLAKLAACAVAVRVCPGLARLAQRALQEEERAFLSERW